MNISLLDQQDRCTLKVSGELDRDTIRSSELTELLSQSDADCLKKASLIVIDMSALKRADTAGLAWLINVIRYLKSQEKAFKVVGIPQKLHALANLSNANDLITTSEISNDA